MAKKQKLRGIFPDSTASWAQYSLGRLHLSQTFEKGPPRFLALNLDAVPRRRGSDRSPGESQPLCAHRGQTACPGLGQLAQSSWPYKKVVRKGNPWWEWCVLALPAALWPAAFSKVQAWMVAKPLRNLSGTDSRVGLGGSWIPLEAGCWGILGPASSVGPGPSVCWACGQGGHGGKGDL